MVDRVSTPHCSLSTPRGLKGCVVSLPFVDWFLLIGSVFLDGTTFTIGLLHDRWKERRRKSFSGFPLPMMQACEAYNGGELQNVENKEGIQQILNVPLVAVYGGEQLFRMFLALNVESKASKSLEDSRPSLLKLMTRDRVR